jgi:hydrogenase-1 operon protein HyaF
MSDAVLMINASDGSAAGNAGDARDVGDVIAAAVLREIAAMLAMLADDTAFSDAIDLHSLPLTDRGREQLRQRLGRGEIDVALDLAGPTRVTETAYAGAWWLRHADADDRTLLEQIVVARVPALLLAHTADIAEAALRLNAETTRPCRETVDD